jgi:hypothetical protein
MMKLSYLPGVKSSAPEESAAPTPNPTVLSPPKTSREPKAKDAKMQAKKQAAVPSRVFFPLMVLLPHLDPTMTAQASPMVTMIRERGPIGSGKKEARAPAVRYMVVPVTK